MLSTAASPRSTTRGMGAELRSSAARALAGLSWVLLGFGLLYLMSALAPDSNQHWESMDRSTTAWIGISALAAAVPVGMVALRLDRPQRHRDYAPGEMRVGLRHPDFLARALKTAVVLAAVLAVLLTGVLR